MSLFKFSYIKLWHSDSKLYGHKLNSGSGKVSMHSSYPQYFMKKSKWVWSGNTTITNRRQPYSTVRKSRSTITRHQEDKLSKATRSLFPIKMIAILEWTQSNVQQNIEQLQTKVHFCKPARPLNKSN